MDKEDSTTSELEVSEREANTKPVEPQLDNEVEFQKPPHVQKKQTRLKFGDQFYALLRKNWRLQKRQKKLNTCQICFSVVILLWLLVIQFLVSKYLNHKRDPDPTPEPEPYDYLSPADIWYSDCPAGSSEYYFSTDFEKLANYTVTTEEGTDQNLATTQYQEFSSADSLDQTLYDSFTQDSFKPAGAIHFDLLNVTTGDVKFSILYNSSSTSTSGSNDHLQLDGETAFLPTLLNTVMRVLYQNISSTSLNIRAAFQKFPIIEGEDQLDIVAYMLGTFFSILLHFLLPIFMMSIVYEKQNNILNIMKMMGLRLRAYWVSIYVFNYLLYLLMLVVFYIFGFAFGFRFFRKNAFLSHFLLFIIWGNTLIAISFLFSLLFKKVRTASIFGYFGVILLVIASSVLFEQLTSQDGTPDSTVILVQLIPSAALYHGINILAMESRLGHSGVSMSDLKLAVDKMGSVYLILFIETLVLFLFFAIFQTSLKTVFCFWRRKSKSKTLYFENDDELDSEDLDDRKNKPTKEEPDDVHRERLRVRKSQDRIRVLGLTKIFKGNKHQPDKVAVNNLSLGISKGECFGFLGPNGAGKTTTVSVMSGLYAPTYGNITVCGYSVREDLGSIHTISSVCPQHDILWDDLTGTESLQFYARMHGYKGAALKERVETTLKQVGLERDGHKKIKEYSGGMKRRISVGCALICNPKVLLLDEPTTGLDPSSKRQLWDVIRETTKDRAVLLTTHSMEEAEALCSRLGIIVNGQLQTIGETQELKIRFGKGFKFSFHSTEESEAKVDKFVRQLMPNLQLLNSLAGTWNYEVSKEGIVLSKIFEELENHKKELEIDDWGISQTTLEEVFLRITQNAAMTN
ncbi:atp-binding cassette transporter subfamily a abca [Anaeramoeba ignava]|uniref:Atp-binding cassette transporter subfamily a abca n=1 Tax=Anaeramoeba ignava TaxID=1746090 RepID=A0A9Q0R877_ANAIG|nr:atp-binding cassette transporter subfamily a abca [Anaeramoeba ignava]|eukprot:Anaeramoba_ignava/a347500_157.p1 GENE.a347500_157~~a347500_157.p1  ORF type:complete len:856 (-),score=232.04 a347500_157:1276-3843(-)